MATHGIHPTHSSLPYPYTHACSRLGRLWLREGAVGGRWSPSEAKGWKRVAVETVENYGLVHEALELAREVRRPKQPSACTNVCGLR